MFKWSWKINFSIFGSLNVSLCNREASGRPAGRPSVNFCFKELLLWNRQSYWLQILKGHSFGDPFSSLFKWCSKINFWIFDEFFSNFSSNIFFSGTVGPISARFYRNIPWEVLYQVCSNGLEKSNFQFFRIFFFMNLKKKIFKCHFPLNRWFSWHDIWHLHSFRGPFPGKCQF